MLTEVEDQDDLQAWADKEEEEAIAKDDPASVAAETLARIAEDLGEKLMVNCSTQLIQEAVSQPDWTARQAGFTYLGMINEPCKKTFSKSLDEMVRMHAQGLDDEHVRVRYQALMSLELLANATAPTFQKKYHSQILPKLFKMAREEELIKMKSQITSVMCSVVIGFIDDEDEDREDQMDSDESKKMMEPHGEDFANVISELLQISLEKQY